MKRTITTQFTVGDTIAYAKRFLRQVCVPATDGAWHRRGRIVATAGQTHPTYTHWKTGELRPIDNEFVLVSWVDDPEVQMIRNENVCKIGGYKYAEEDGGVPFRG